MRVKHLKIHNILSIADAELSFDERGLILVEGWNHDSDRSNGAGKTAIFNALSFAVYGKLPRSITATEILRKGSKSCYTEVTIDVNNVIYKIRRSRPSDLQFWVDGVHIKEMTQEEFESKLRLTYPQFLSSMYASQGSSSRFIDLSDGDKKDFFIRAMNVDKFNECRQAVEADLKKDRLASYDLKQKFAALQAKIAAYKESIPDEQELRSQAKQLEDQLEELNKNYINIESVLKPDTAKYEALESDLELKREQIADAKIDRASVTAKLTRIDDDIRKLSADDECPTCGAPMVGLEDEIAKLQATRSDLVNAIDRLDKLISKEADLNNLRKSLVAEKKTKMAEWNSARERRSELNLSIGMCKNKLSGIQETLASIDLIKTRIRSAEDNINIYNIELTKLSSKIVVDELVSELYSPTGAQAYILETAVNLFNEFIQDYIGSIWSNATYRLNAFKENKDGAVKAKFSDTLLIDGSQRSIGSLSGGERRALSIASDLAIMDVMSKQFGFDLNPIVLDEPFDCLDAAGRDVVIDLLSNLAATKCVMVIDHMSESNAAFSKVIRVEKRSGVTSIV